MALVEIKVPSPGESITEVVIARWLKKEGDFVEKDEELAEIDSDKATLTITAECSGILKINAQEGDTVKVGEVICSVDTNAGQKIAAIDSTSTISKAQDVQPVGETESSIKKDKNIKAVKGHVTPLAKEIMEVNKISLDRIEGTGVDGRIMKADVLKVLVNSSESNAEVKFEKTRAVERSKISPLRKKLAQRLVAVKNETAMLTTFNEVDMSSVFAIRAKYKEKFKQVYDVNLGFMSFFTKAVTEALVHFPAVNAMIDGDEIVYHKYADIGIAVSAPKGLMVPVIRNAEQLSFAQIEIAIRELATKARDNKITLEEMSGGTFTITNGGVFGSMLSTPILNPPQSAILGMHNIVDRPVAVNGQVVIRPMMYLALSYDHRIIDGRESVGFLVKVKEMIENPLKMLFNGKDPEEIVLDL